MKNILFAALALATLSLPLPSNAAGSDGLIEWNLIGLHDHTGSGLENVRFDVNVGTIFVHLFGSVRFENGLAAPVDGSCFVPVGGLIFCTVALGFLTLSLDVNIDFSGEATLTDASGFVISTGAMVFVSFD